jgi:hypothetical protein
MSGDLLPHSRHFIGKAERLDEQRVKPPIPLCPVLDVNRMNEPVRDQRPA